MSLHIASYTRNIDRCYPLIQKLWVGGQQISINDGQKKSIEMALGNNFQLIQGPPGNMYAHTKYLPTILIGLKRLWFFNIQVLNLVLANASCIVIPI